MPAKLPASEINYLPWPGIRAVEGAHEFTSYPPGSSFRVWYGARAGAYDAHWHADTEIIMVTEGSVVVTAPGRKYELRPGDILLIPAGVTHGVETAKGGARYVFLFEMNNSLGALKCLTPLIAVMTVPVLIARDTAISGEATAILNGIVREYSSDHPFRELRNYAAILSLFSLIGRQQLITVYQTTGELTGNKRAYSDLFARVQKYLNEHYEEASITLDQIAAEAGFSRCHFSRFFKKYAGVTFHKYITHMRLTAAEALLCVTSLSITEIALQVGFTSVPTFNRVYKKDRGLTPSEYRALHRDDAREEGRG